MSKSAISYVLFVGPLEGAGNRVGMIPWISLKIGRAY